MTLKDINQLHQIHPLHARYLKFDSDKPLIEALANQAVPFSIDDYAGLEQLGDRVYKKGKWTVRDILQHLIDTERILSYRALTIARNEQAALPGFDETAYAAHTLAGQRSINGLLQELALVRRSTILLFKNFDEAMMNRIGLCNNIPVSVLVLGYVIAGHYCHHLAVLRERYLPLLGGDRIHIVEDNAYLPHFERLNRAWIEKDFQLEPDDRYVLGQPKAAILDAGGAVLFARCQGHVTGTVALQPIRAGEFEMIKMAVDEAHRGKGAGQLLIRAAIFKANELGVKTLSLHSNTNANAAAVRLYRRLGFEEVPITESRYQRANIKMEIQI